MIQIMSKTFSAYTKPSSKVIADTGRSSGKVIRRKRCHPLAPSIAAASKTSGEMLCSPLYMMTRLNGMPIQMFAISTATRDQRGEVSQSTCPMPKARRKEFTIPESLSSIHDQVEAETSSGRSHGTRNRARRMPERRNLRKKNTASARPMANWNAIETKTTIAGVDEGGGERGALDHVGVVGKSRERSDAGNERREGVAPDAQVDVARSEERRV